MRTIKAIAVFAVLVLTLTCAAGTVSAGVEPSPFKSKTIENRIQVARHQMIIMGCTLDRFKARLNELNYKGSRMAAENQINILQSGACNTLRTLESAKGLYDQRRDDDDIYDYSEYMEWFQKVNDALQDDVIDIERHPFLSKEAKLALRQFVSLLLAIENVIDDFLTGNVD